MGLDSGLYSAKLGTKNLQSFRACHPVPCQRTTLRVDALMPGSSCLPCAVPPCPRCLRCRPSESEKIKVWCAFIHSGSNSCMFACVCYLMAAAAAGRRDQKSAFARLPASLPGTKVRLGLGWDVGSGICGMCRICLVCVMCDV